MQAVILTGTIVAATALLLLTRSETNVAIASSSNTLSLRFQHNALQYNGSTATVPIDSITATVDGTPTYTTYTLTLFIDVDGITTDEATVTFALSKYASVAAIAAYMQTTIRAVRAEFSGVTVTVESSKLRITNARSFNFSEDNDPALLVALGFTNAPLGSISSPFTTNNVLAAGVCDLVLYGFSATYKMGAGDTITLQTSSATSFHIESTGPFIASEDGISHVMANVLRFETQARIMSILGNTLTIRYRGFEATTPLTKTYSVTTHTFSASGTFTLPVNTRSVYVEVVGAGATSKGNFTYGGAGAVISGYLTELTPGNTYAVTVGTYSGSATILDGTTTNVVKVIAAGGGEGGSDTAGNNNLRATGGSGYGFHGRDGIPAYVHSHRLGIHSSLQGTQGKGGTSVAGGAAGSLATTGSGSAGFGGTFGDHASGGDGHFGGGAGGRTVYLGKTLYGGAGAGSCYARGLTCIQVSRPALETTTPTASKFRVSGTYGNGGSLQTAFGLGYALVRIITEP